VSRPTAARVRSSRAASAAPVAPAAPAPSAASGASAATPTKRLFGSLFLGGFECSNHLTPDGHRMDLIAATQHDRFAAEDYARCRAVGIRAVRESARWPIAEVAGGVNLTEVRRLARLGREYGLTQIWDLLHYGYPADLDAGKDDFGDRLVDRLQNFAAGVARAVRDEIDGPGWYTPVNEISYTAWAGGDVGIISPFWHGRGWDYKVLLVRAAIAAFDAIRSVDPTARVLTAEPLVRLHVHPGVEDDEERRRLQRDADDFNQRVVSEAYDMLAGRVAPELGGSRDHLGVVGVNYYEGNQWTIPTPTLPQHFLGRDETAWLALRDLLRELSDRYGGPVVISETGSTGTSRPAWLRHLVAEAEGAIAQGVDVQGICLYPIVTSPDWNDPAAFFDGGLWDVVPQADGSLERVLEPLVAMALQDAQLRLDPGNVTGALEGLPPSVEPELPVEFGKLLELARFSPDGFVCVPVLAGEAVAVDLYCFEPGKSVAAHRHHATEHVLTAIQGQGDVRVGDRWFILAEGETVLVPSGVKHGIHNPTTDRLLVQQVSSPKPWDARFGGPRPSDVRRTASQTQ
jgi:quercetin dioxygenase-like cupin family protein